MTYEVYCTAIIGFETEDVDPPFPIVEIQDCLPSFNDIQVVFYVNRPGTMCCNSFAYVEQYGNETLLRPEPPDQDAFEDRKFCVTGYSAGIYQITIDSLPSGMLYDIFCFAEEYSEVEKLNLFRTDRQSILATRTRSATLGVKTAAFKCSLGESLSPKVRYRTFP